METIKLTDSNVEKAAKKAADVLRAGGVILYPTDTLYGLGADAFSDEGFEKVCMIKGRDERRPIHAVFSDFASVDAYAVVSPVGQKLADAFLPGPLTLVLEKKKHLTSGIARSLSTIGIRVPRNPFCLSLAREFGRPYTTTSANVSNEKPLSTVAEIIAQLGEKAAYVDLAIDAGPLSPEMRSTVVDARHDAPFILRDGVITADEIERALRS